LEARNIAIASIGAKVYMWDIAGEEAYLQKEQNDPHATYKPQGELVVCRGYDGKQYLAYKFNIYAKQPLSRNYVYVDAQSGSVIFKDPIIKHADNNGSGATKYSGTHTVRTNDASGVSGKPHCLRTTTMVLEEMVLFIHSI